ncbi:endonuclease domain-containing protein [Micromonospora sp. SH-82]|uniref:endonuclease domain-containing protein n=1 Tax=Micromonospora sp. SH-82 TaxID=3132938 RepID=UPI003EBD27E0
MTLARDLAGLPTDRVVQIGGVRTGPLATEATHRLTEVAPVVLDSVVHRADTAIGVVRAALDRLERIATELLPGWLPEAAAAGPRVGPVELVAARAAARTLARGSAHSGPFLAELVTVALTGRRESARTFPLETRCLGLSRVVTEGFGRRRLVLLIECPAGLDAVAQQAVVAGAEWLAHHGRVGVWLTGEPLDQADRPDPVLLSEPPTTATPPDPVGRPHPASAAEATLEAALAVQGWAGGRRWNQTYQPRPLDPPIRLDLIWPDERCVVEIDGPEHCHPSRFEADRQRDVRLQLDGYAVLRFTNARINHDVGSVVHQIGTFLRARRRDPSGRNP